MSYKITLLPGDGIGPEVMQAMRNCVEATGVDIEWEVHQVGEYAIKEHETPIPDEVIESIRRNKVAIKGPITTPIGCGFRSANVFLRQSLNLYACVRPIKNYEGVKSLFQDVDIIIHRENTEDLYAGVELEVGESATKKLIKQLNSYQKIQIKEDSGISIKSISISATKKIIRAALEYAQDNNRKKVTIVHKANIMKFTDGLFLKTALDVAKDFEGKVIVEDIIIDNLCMQLVQRPQEFDILVLPNLYGDIVSELCAGLVGGIGVTPGVNLGDEIALFESVHGSAPQYAGLNKCNPTATILSAVLMLRYLNEGQAADRLENAVKDVLKEGKYVTFDLKNTKDDPTAVGTQEMAEAICKKM